MKDVEELAKEFKELTSLVGKRRQDWNDKIESQIEDKLSYYVDNLDLDLYVDINNFEKNRHAVYLSFKAKPSGISVVILPRSFKAYVSEPNYLCYSQSVNGKILVWIHFSYVKEIESQPEPFVIGYYEPIDVVDDLIESHVKQFLEKIIQHEKEIEKNPIGFNK